MIYRVSIFLVSTILFLSSVCSGVALGENGSVLGLDSLGDPSEAETGADVPTVAGWVLPPVIDVPFYRDETPRDAFVGVKYIGDVSNGGLPETNKQAGVDTWTDLKGGTVTGTKQTESTGTETVDILDWGGYKIGEEQRDVFVTTQQPFKAKNPMMHFKRGGFLENGKTTGTITIEGQGIEIPAAFEIK